MIFEDFCHYRESFLKHIKAEKNLSTHTYRAYESDLQQLIEFWNAMHQREPIKHSLKAVIERYIALLYHKKIDTTSIARKMSCLNSYEKFVASKHGIQLNLQLARPRIDKKLYTCLSVDEVVRQLDSILPEKMPTQFPLRDKAIFELLYATGIRCSELVALQMRDVNLLEKSILIQGKKGRRISFGTSCEKKLLQYLSHERVAVKHTAEYLFLNYRQEPLTTRSIQRICGMVRTFFSIKRPLTPHKLRHSFATQLIQQGTDLKTVQNVLGHKTLASAEKYINIIIIEPFAKLSDTHDFEQSA